MQTVAGLLRNDKWFQPFNLYINHLNQNQLIEKFFVYI